MFRLKCISCSKEYPVEPGRYVCDDCGALKGTLEVIYPLEDMTIKRDFSPNMGMFQFEELLPVRSHTPLDRHIGGTPLIRLNNYFGYEDLYIKYDGTNLSASYKDRASIIAINRAIEEGNDHIFCASTGNAASSLALLNAHTSMKTSIFVPATIPEGKLAQLLVAGADVYPVKASYDEVFDLSLDIGLKRGWYTRNSAINPYLLEGKKTGAYEIAVQCNYDLPDYCFVSVGDGTIISGICKGFKEFYDLGLTDKIPKVIGVQAQGANTIMRAFDTGDYTKMTAHTIADSIAVGNPRDIYKACKYVRENGGYFMAVTDDDIVDAISLLAKGTGIFAEPAGAVPLAGLIKSKVKKHEKVCLIVTGNGLKDTSNIALGDVNKYDFLEVEDVIERRFHESNGV